MGQGGVGGGVGFRGGMGDCHFSLANRRRTVEGSVLTRMKFNTKMFMQNHDESVGVWVNMCVCLCVCSLERPCGGFRPYWPSKQFCFVFLCQVHAHIRYPDLRTLTETADS